jgi:hypothetical protein
MMMTVTYGGDGQRTSQLAVVYTRFENVKRT